MRFTRRLGVAALLLGLFGPGAAFAVRDPWFPDGPLQPALEKGILLPPKVRTPQFPLKTARTLHTDAEIATARDNVKKYPVAQAQAKLVFDQADYWLPWSDAELAALVTTAEVPRAAELCQAGCPVHGKKIYEVGGTYPWLVDPRVPFKVKCPIGGETYPDNDYGAYYRSGFRDTASLTGKIVDDGWGWVAPDGQRYWFVAHANHLLWHRLDTTAHCIDFAAGALGRAYVLTGDRRYAHKAAVLLRRIAEVYPNMNHEQQSRFGQLMREQGTRYVGKVVNGIWEAWSAVPTLSEAYDNVWETIDDDRELQSFFHQSGEQLRAFIEANYLEDAIDAVFADLIRGNYGTHQRALLQLAVVRQHGDTKRYVDEVLHRADGHFLRVGFNYALNDLVFRDGAAHESPDYNFTWVRTLAASAELLKRLGYDLSTLPRLKRMFDHPLEFVAIGAHSPALGDSRTVYAPVIGDDALVYQGALRLYDDARYATFLAGFGAAGEKGFQSYDALFSPPLEPRSAPVAAGRELPPQPSRLLGGYGYAVLNNAADTIAVGLYFGEHVNHYHHDRLHFDLFAHGQAMTPDLGYPDTMNDFNAGIFTWSKTTIAHNTVTVDAARQNPNPAGTLRLFADGPFARAVSVDAEKTYAATSTYRRTLVMVDSPATAEHAASSYVVDFFDVVGGHQHDYSLHGPPGTFKVISGGPLAERAPGTLAGEKVALGEIYDDPVRGAKDFAGSFRDYRGSGFQYLFNVQRAPAGTDAIPTFVAEYAHEKDSTAKLRIHVLRADQSEIEGRIPDAQHVHKVVHYRNFESQDLLVADAHVSPVKHPELIKYLITRRIAVPDDKTFTSTFAAVLEPVEGPPLKSVVWLGASNAGKSLAWVHVLHADGSDETIFHNPAGGSGRSTVTPKFASDESAVAPALVVSTDATITVISRNSRGEPTRVWFAGGTIFESGAIKLTATPLDGTVASVDAATSTVRVTLGEKDPVPDPAALIGRVMTLSNPLRNTAHTIAAARVEGRELVLTTKDDLRVGLIRVATASPTALTTKNSLLLAATYHGATLADQHLKPLGRIREVQDGTVTLDTDLPAGTTVKPGEDAWFLDLGPGDRIHIPGTASWTK